MAREIVILSESRRLRDVMQAAIENDEFHVNCCSIASFELSMLAAWQPDLIILDWYLGLEDQGLQALQSLKLYAPLADLPVIICSAPTMLIRGMREHLQRANTFLLCKPFARAELRATVETALAGIAAEALDSRVATTPRWLRRIGSELAGDDSRDDARSDAVAWSALAADGLSVS
jgi:DNA-binding response OmpR family regulator